MNIVSPFFPGVSTDYEGLPEEVKGTALARRTFVLDIFGDSLDIDHGRNGVFLPQNLAGQINGLAEGRDGAVHMGGHRTQPI